MIEFNVNDLCHTLKFDQKEKYLYIIIELQLIEHKIIKIRNEA